MAVEYNLSKVYQIPENDVESARQIVSLFISEVPNEIKAMKIGINEKDYIRVYASAHKIGPSLDLLGMDIAYDENLKIIAWSQSKGKRKEIIDTYKSLHTRIELAVKEIKKDFKIK